MIFKWKGSGKMRKAQTLLKPKKGSLKESDIALVASQGRHHHHSIPNLSLRVSKTGKSWVFAYTSPTRTAGGKGKRIERGLGSYDPRHIAQIERKAISLNGQLALGVDPFEEIEQKKAQEKEEIEAAETEAEIRGLKQTKFKTVFESFIEFKRGEWSQRKSALMPVSERNWRSMINAYGKPLMELPFEQVTKKVIAECVEPIWASHSYSASKFYNRVRDIHFWWCAKNDLDDIIPLPESVKRLYLGKAKVKRDPHKDLPYIEVPAFWQALSELPEEHAVIALKLAILTGARPAEMRELRWEHLRESKVFGKHIELGPDETKTGDTYRWPVLPAIGKLLDHAREAFAHDEWVIPSPHRVTRNRPLTEGATRKVIERIGYKDRTTVHGFRKALKTWALQEAELEPWLADALLQHKVLDTYFKPVDVWQKRCEALSRYHQYLGAA